MLAKRLLVNEIDNTDDWAVGDNLKYVASFKFKKFEGRSDLLDLTLNSKGNNFWNLNGIFDFNDL